MENAMRHLPAIRKRIGKDGCIVMLDFDGTLSPLAPHPGKAVLSARTRGILGKAVMKFPIAVISGRTLADIQKRVGIKGILYAGEHGHQWSTGARTYRHAMPRRAARALVEAKRALLSIADAHPDLIVENKHNGIALQYRALVPEQRKMFRKSARLAMAGHVGRGTRSMDDLGTFELLADTGWSKGHCALLLRDAIRRTDGRKRTPVYIGDSMTDEDAFRMLKNGITIRVRKKKSSAARYFLARREDVDSFIEELIRNV